MVKSSKTLVLFITNIFVLIFGRSIEFNEERKDYIVYLGSKSNKYSVDSAQHINILQQALDGRRSVEGTLIRSYTKSFNGFAAKLTQKEYEILNRNEQVVSIFPSRTLQLHTTRSWDFLGLPPPTVHQQKAESDVIIGIFDTGIWPELPNFDDTGLGPVPSKWKGVCLGGVNFTCNRKIIGARGYLGTARDDEGHGTHTASTAAGRIVKDASFYGIAEGSARGGVPSARIAVYKVCNVTGCKEKNVMAAFDDAIADGVDIISISLGGEPVQFDSDSIAIGAFHAMQHGILTVQSSGNEGAFGVSTGSVAPWILSVAGSSTDRRIIDKVILGNGDTLIGNSVNRFSLEGKYFPLVYGKSTSTQCDEASAKLCTETCLDEHLIRGKIVVCDGGDPYAAAFNANARGVLTMASFQNVSFVYPLPSASLNQPEFNSLTSYISSTKDPKASILKSAVTNDTNAPVVAEFSSRGPNFIASEILKPDITAPGVDILAAFSPEAHISQFTFDKRSVKYNVLSGTSMACPHVVGAAAYVKSVHPDWSPAAIKSALMTTADPMSASKNPEAEFAYGSGHLNPAKAAHPGLIYNATQYDYITLLCTLGYNNKTLTFTGNTNITCPNNLTTPDSYVKDVNYPSMAAMVNAEKPFTVKFNRIVTNVGKVNSTYTAKVTSGPEIQVTVNPKILKFVKLKERKSFEVTVVGKGLSSAALASASLVWSDGIHTVRSPIVVYYVMS